MNDTFFQEYTSQEAITKYTRATAGFGIAHLLDHDYKRVYLQAIRGLSPAIRQTGLHILEFGCGGGMNLIHLVSMLSNEGVRVTKAMGSDFSPVLIEAARHEAKNYLPQSNLPSVEFHVAKNESLKADIAVSAGIDKLRLENSFHFILGVNTIRYCHAAGKEFEAARGILDLLAPGGVCVVIDMNNRYPFFRSDLRNRFRRQKEEECYVPTLQEYAAPFEKAGFEIVRKEHFCWIPHSVGPLTCWLFASLSPILNVMARSRAMRSLVVAKKPS